MLPQGANSFLLAKMPFQKEENKQFDNVISPKIASIALNVDVNIDIKASVVQNIEQDLANKLVFKTIIGCHFTTQIQLMSITLMQCETEWENVRQERDLGAQSHSEDTEKPVYTCSLIKHSLSLDSVDYINRWQIPKLVCDAQDNLILRVSHIITEHLFKVIDANGLSCR